MGEEKKLRRLGATERQTAMHVMKQCIYSGTDEMIEDLMSEKGQGIVWMKKVKKKQEGKG